MKPCIVIDIDGTWSAFRSLLEPLYNDSWYVNIPCIFASAREQPLDKLQRILPSNAIFIPALNGQSKFQAVVAAGWQPMMWIDNEPWTIAPERNIKTPDDSLL